MDTYAVTVGTDVDKVIVSADCTDGNATKVVSGNEGLQMGENRVTCRVTAQDGETIKEYVIVVTKAEGGASAADADASSQVRMRIAERVITILPYYSPMRRLRCPSDSSPPPLILTATRYRAGYGALRQSTSTVLCTA